MLYEPMSFLNNCPHMAAATMPLTLMSARSILSRSVTLGDASKCRKAMPMLTSFDLNASGCPHAPLPAERLAR
jgi:hypothetical protein